MAFSTELDVINDMLGLLGETPLNTLDDDHPLVAAGRRLFRIARYTEMSKGWWFNQELVTLTPDAATGHISVPADTISVDPVDATLNYVQRGSRLYKAYADSSEDPWVFTLPVQCWLVRDVPFEDAPLAAQTVISLGAQRAFQKSHDGDPQKAAMLADDYRTAYMHLNAEHTRNKNANLLRNPSFQAKMRRLAPASPRLATR